ncbi:flavodoxin [Streptomyces sp. NPDC086766]|uniref:flavodoxin n=1 Tax=Streptomyces sp. NPDC086766 TaxID=3365754 RepID=UPI00382BC62A
MITPQHLADTALPSRRTVLRGTLLSATAALSATYLAACSSSSPRPGTPTSSPSAATTGSNVKRVLLAYFSRPGENYSYGGRTDLKVGNTEVPANKIGSRITCDTYRIQAADPYPHDYDATVQRNVREQDTDARPAVNGRLPLLDGYDTILLASPIWNVRAPMIMTTFTEALDFRGKTIHPVTTYAMSGLGTTERDYAASCPGATIAEGLAVRGEEVNDADTEVEAWLRRTGLPAR